MANEDEGYRAGFEVWEESAIAYWATRVLEPAQQKELRAELVRKLLILRAESRAGIRHPKAYVRTALANTAKTWLRKLNAAKKAVPFDESPTPRDSPEYPALAVRQIGRDEGDFGIALERFWADLAPRLQRFVIVLERKNGNVSAAARALRIHRNTASLWLKKIRAIAAKHALGD